MSTARSEFQTKIKLLRALVEKYGKDAVLLRRVSSFAWATCGAASYVNSAATEGAATLLISRDRLYLITNNIEAPRMEQEEKLAEQGWEFHVSPWHMPLLALENLISNLSLISDVPFSGSINVSDEIFFCIDRIEKDVVVIFLTDRNSRNGEDLGAFRACHRSDHCHEDHDAACYCSQENVHSTSGKEIIRRG